MGDHSGLTIQRLKEVVSYDPITGDFRWLNAARGRYAGALAGRFSGQGRYRQLCIDYHYYYAHRLAWLYMTGTWPPVQIDHIDTNRTNNRFDNLRLAIRRENQGNRNINARNKSGVKGVRWYAKTGKWQARLSINSQSQHLGYFNTIEEAASAYAVAARAHFGSEFARTA